MSKQKQKCRFRISSCDSFCRYYQEVEGELIEFEDFEDFTFTLHRERPGWWVVSEASTGTLIKEGPTREITIEGTDERLRRRGVLGLTAAIAKTRAEQKVDGVPFEQLPGVVKPRESA